MRFRIAQSTTVFTRPGSVWLPRVLIFERFAEWVSEWVEFNAPLDTIQVISEGEKDSIRGQRFGCDEEVIDTINDWFELQDKQFFVDGVNSLAHRWESALCLKGIILKNYKVNFTIVICVSDFLITYSSTLVYGRNWYTGFIILNSICHVSGNLWSEHKFVLDTLKHKRFYLCFDELLTKKLSSSLCLLSQLER